MSHFPNLFKPITIGNFEVPNRILHESTDISSSHADGSVSDLDIHHHAEIAKGGESTGCQQSHPARSRVLRQSDCRRKNGYGRPVAPAFGRSILAGESVQWKGERDTKMHIMPDWLLAGFDACEEAYRLCSQSSNR